MRYRITVARDSVSICPITLTIKSQKLDRSNEQTRWEFAVNLPKRQSRLPPCCRGWRPLPSCDDPQWIVCLFAAQGAYPQRDLCRWRWGWGWWWWGGMVGMAGSGDEWGVGGSGDGVGGDGVGVDGRWVPEGRGGVGGGGGGGESESCFGCRRGVGHGGWGGGRKVMINVWTSKIIFLIDSTNPTYSRPRN